MCREDAEACVGADIPISVSIGVAQWTREMGAFPDRLIAAADHALYAAKKDGKNRHAVYDPRAAAGARAPILERCRNRRCASTPERATSIGRARNLAMIFRLLAMALCAIAISRSGLRADARPRGASRVRRARPRFPA